MKIYKKINLYLLVVNVLVGVLVFFLMLQKCFGSCSYELRQSLLRPIMSFSLGLFFILIFLLFFKPTVFKHWLIFIASWYIPVSIYLVSQISINSSNILATDRSTASLVLMVGLFGLTVLFVVVHSLVFKSLKEEKNDQ